MDNTLRMCQRSPITIGREEFNLTSFRNINPHNRKTLYKLSSILKTPQNQEENDNENKENEGGEFVQVEEKEQIIESVPPKKKGKMAISCETEVQRNEQQSLQLNNDKKEK